jgi:Caspase domain
LKTAVYASLIWNKNMSIQPLAKKNIAGVAIKAVAFAAALLCTSLLLPSHAQTKAGAAPDGRNLQVQAVAASSTQSNQRVALVIGNAAYKEAPLTNPVNDARAIAQALKESGFTVILRENTDQRGMLAALREFGDKLRGGGTGLFYYAGHGMQIKGRNYLIPVGANVDREDEVAYSAVDAQAVLDKMESAGNAANIMILDACRNNPFTRSSRSGQGGLAQMEAPVGTLVAFATSPGAVASDGAGENGLYTQHLLTAMRQQGSKVEDVFKQVRANVRRDSQGKQVPWESTSLEGDFYFKGGAATAATAAAPADAGAALEAALWDVVKNSSVPIELRAYLNRYPAGRYAAQASARLAQLQPDNAATPGAVAAAPGAAKPVAANPNPNTTAANIPDASSNGKDQAAIDRRTEELLASLMSSPGPGQLVKPASSSAKPQATANAFGFTVGDRWRYQQIDQFKKEVTHNWERRITGIDSQANLVLNNGSVVWRQDGVLLQQKEADGSTLDWSGYRLFPTTLRAGYSEKENYTLTWKRSDANGSEVRDGEVKVIGMEKVKVPAGEFEAWKIEHRGFISGKNLTANATYTQRYIDVHWYVPALRNFVAHEYERRNSAGAVDRFSRNELTSYSLRGSDSFAQR